MAKQLKDYNFKIGDVFQLLDTGYIYVVSKVFKTTDYLLALEIYRDSVEEVNIALDDDEKLKVIKKW